MKTYVIMLDNGLTHTIQEFQATNIDDALGNATDYFKSLFPNLDWNKTALEVIHINWL